MRLRIEALMKLIAVYVLFFMVIVQNWTEIDPEINLLHNLTCGMDTAAYMNYGMTTRQTLTSNMDNSHDTIQLKRSLQNKNINRFNHSWRPSQEWLECCVVDVSNNNLEMIPFSTPPLWDGYRLGDCIKQCEDCHLNSPINSFANLYAVRNCVKSTRRHGLIMRTTTTTCHDCVENNYNFVREMLDTYSGTYPYSIPAKDELVLHLRLGDVIEYSNTNIITMLSKGGDPSHHKNFASAIKSVNEYLDNIAESGLQKVSIRGGSHDPFMYSKSRVYAGCLKRAIEIAGYEVSMELDSGNPDQDFYYMSFANKIVVSTGGYSRIIGNLVKERGGEIIGRTF